MEDTGNIPPEVDKRVLEKIPDRENPNLMHLFLAFLWLGTTAFGGPAMVAYIRDLSVKRKKWLDQDMFKRGVALCQTIPGATAIQVAAFIWERRINAQRMPGQSQKVPSQRLHFISICGGMIADTRLLSGW